MQIKRSDTVIKLLAQNRYILKSDWPEEIAAVSRIVVLAYLIHRFVNMLVLVCYFVIAQLFSVLCSDWSGMKFYSL